MSDIIRLNHGWSLGSGGSLQSGSSLNLDKKKTFYMDLSMNKLNMMETCEHDVPVELF